MPTIYLVRHAHADWTPSEARPLSSRGRASALWLAERIGSRAMAAIYSSPARRATQTVAPLAERRGLTPIVVDDLRERELLVPSGLTFEDAVAQVWATPDASLPASESNRVAQTRGLNALKAIMSAHPRDDVVVSTHGSLLTLVLNGFDQRIGYEFWQRLSFPDVYAARVDGDTLVDLERIWDVPLRLEPAVAEDAVELATLRTAVADRLTRDFGHGHWSSAVSAVGQARAIQQGGVFVARERGPIVATVRLATKKPWAIDPAYFTKVARPLYLSDMAVAPECQRRGVGREVMTEAARVARDRPADAIRLDAYDTAAGAGAFYAKCGLTQTGRVVYRRTPLVYYELLIRR